MSDVEAERWAYVAKLYKHSERWAVGTFAVFCWGIGIVGASAAYGEVRPELILLLTHACLFGVLRAWRLRKAARAMRVAKE